jgi:DNA-binding transcriptional MerR regulator
VTGVDIPGNNDQSESWSIQQVARLSGVSARTLRYYDEIGLLPPARIGANGYRYYRQPQLLRLQEILLLRELGLDLRHIGQVVDGERDKLDALRHHHDRLLAERDRFAQLARTVATTITSLQRGLDMTAEDMFAGFRFTRETVDELEDLVTARTGQRAPRFDQIRAGVADWDEATFQRFEQDSMAVERRLLELLRAGVACDDPRVLDVLDEDRAVQQRIVSLSRDEYVQLGEAFVATPELRAHLDAQHAELAEYLRDAMAAYAAIRMT